MCEVGEEAKPKSQKRTMTQRHERCGGGMSASSRENKGVVYFYARPTGDFCEVVVLDGP